MNEGKSVGWIAFYNRKKVEISNKEAKDLYSAKQVAIKKLKVPKSKVGMLAIEPAYADDDKNAPAPNAQFEGEVKEATATKTKTGLDFGMIDIGDEFTLEPNSSTVLLKIGARKYRDERGKSKTLSLDTPVHLYEVVMKENKNSLTNRILQLNENINSRLNEGSANWKKVKVMKHFGRSDDPSRSGEAYQAWIGDSRALVQGSRETGYEWEVELDNPRRLRKGRERDLKRAMKAAEKNSVDEVAVNEGGFKVGQKIPSKLFVAKWGKGGGDNFVVIHRGTKGMSGSQDKFQMFAIDSAGNITKDWGSHMSLQGAKKMAQKLGYH